MSRTRKTDRPLFVATLLLVCTSVVMVYSASAVVAMDRFQQPNLFLTKQALWAALGLAVLAIASRIDYRLYKDDRVVWAVLGVVVALLTNRIHPTRDNAGIRALRPALHDAVMRELGF